MRFFGEFDVIDRLILGFTGIAAAAVLIVFVAVSAHPVLTVVNTALIAVWGPAIVRMRHGYRSRMDPEAPRVDGISIRRLFGDLDSIGWALLGVAAVAPIAAAVIATQVTDDSLWLALVVPLAFIAAMLLAGFREYRRALRQGRSIAPVEPGRSDNG